MSNENKVVEKVVIHFEDGTERVLEKGTVIDAVITEQHTSLDWTMINIDHQEMTPLIHALLITFTEMVGPAYALQTIANYLDNLIQVQPPQEAQPEVQQEEPQQ